MEEEEILLEKDPEVEKRISKFRSDLLRVDAPVIVHKHIMFGECFMLDSEKYYALKREVAKHFKVHTSEVLVVGSAKLGFSIAPDIMNTRTQTLLEKKRYRQFYDKSDIDVVIVAGYLFDEIWQNVFDYWDSMVNMNDWSENYFRKYLFRGWIRPDKLPPTRTFERQSDWWNFFQDLTNSGDFGPYPIAGALYKSWHYLERYQLKNVIDCQQLEKSLKGEKL